MGLTPQKPVRPALEQNTAEVRYSPLIRISKQRNFLILGRHPVQCSAAIAKWFARHAADIRMFLLPAYSPELNPDAMLNQDVKSNALGRRRPWNETEMTDGVRVWSDPHAQDRRASRTRGFDREDERSGCVKV